MNNYRMIVVLGVPAVCIAAFVTFSIQAVDELASGTPGDVDMAAMMQEWMKLSQPGKPHERLMAMVGEWDVTTRMFMAGPESQPIESTGTSSIRSVLGGRFILEQNEAQMLMPDANGRLRPTSFEGIGMTGYDNYKNLFVGSWADSMGTVLLTFEGVDNPTKPDELTFTARWTNRV